MQLTENEERDVRQYIGLLLNDFQIDNTEIISGSASGVDSIAVEVARSLGFTVLEYPPEGSGWEYNKKRNLIIAKECDELYCISVPVHKKKCYHHLEPQNHEKTAGCWTLNKVKEMGKTNSLIVIPDRSF